MSLRLEEWLERMLAATSPGPVARITATRNNRDAGWIFEVKPDTNLAELAERIDNACRDAGFGAIYELRALDAEGNFIAPFAHKAQVAEIVPANVGPPPVPIGVDASIAASLRSNRSFTGLGLDAIMKALRATERLVDRLEGEVAELKKENARLRSKLADHWDTMHKLNTNELETKQDKDKIERMGRMGETFANALMARVLGRAATPEGQVVEYRLAMTLFRSLANDMERVQKILPHLTEAEQLAVMELMRPKEDPPPKPEQKPNEIMAAMAAAAINSGKAA